MKFCRWGHRGCEKPGAVDEDGNIRDLSNLIEDITPQVIGSRAMANISYDDLYLQKVVAPESRLGSCVSSVPNFYCIGLNYHKPGAPADMEGSNKVVITSKASSALSGANDDIFLPYHSSRTDWEVELGVVIAKECWNVPLEDAMDYVFGYCIVNDICERDYMFEHGGQWIKGKSLPGYGPAGPWLVTKDEVKDTQNLDIWLKRNGEYVQNSNTSQMINGVAKIISHMSRYMMLMPGDLVATGTPPGIGMHRNPPCFLQEGDNIELGITHLGKQSAQIRRAAL